MCFVLLQAATQVLEPKAEIFITSATKSLQKVIANPLTYLSIESKLYPSCRSAA